MGWESFHNGLKGQASDQVLRVVYDYFSEAGGGKFPVIPSDDLAEVYGMVDDDVPDEIAELARKCGYPQPSKEDSCRVQTVVDTVALMEKLRLGPAARHPGQLFGDSE